MSDFLHLVVGIAPTAKAPVDGIRLVYPKHIADAAKCEGYVDVGFFFDGTNNNRDRDKPNLGHSNIARLFETYREETIKGYFRVYVPGVGTPFHEIGEEGESDWGKGFGIGCEERTLFGLLRLYDAIHRAAFNDTPYFTDAQVKALCTTRVAAPNSNGPLAEMGLHDGLLIPETFGQGERENILREQARWLERKLVKGRPIIKECFVDVFGFSRGAAEVRVFCQWLDRLLVDGKLAGVIIHLRFVGLMDTVASAGCWSTTLGNVTNDPGGHAGWAAPQYLLIPESVENCVHMVAMHELRKNFPLDEARVGAELPRRTQEFAYPGSHSDVGGGYLPGELGISVGSNPIESDALKLSQIPLNHMLECAVAAGAPMNKTWIPADTPYDQFAISPRVMEAYNAFLAASTMKARPIFEWMQPYLNWRWENRLTYASLAHVRNASASDQAKLIKFNKILISDAELIQRNSGKLRQLYLRAFAKGDRARMLLLDVEAPAVLDTAQKAAPTSAALHQFFDRYVHDSLAGFDKPELEETGYWRNRKGFLGSDIGQIVFNTTEDTAEEAT